jgi:hypothetical protein
MKADWRYWQWLAAMATSQYFIKSDASAIYQGSPVEVELTGGTAAIITSAGWRW